MALVIVVMREAAKPGLYQTFFGPTNRQGWVSTIPETPRVPPNSNPTPPVRSNSLPDQPLPDGVVPSDRAVLANAGTPTLHDDTPGDETAYQSSADLNAYVTTWVSQLPVPLQREWIGTLIAWKQSSAAPVSSAGTTPDQISAALDALPTVTPPELELWAGQLRANLEQLRDAATDVAEPQEPTVTTWTSIADWAEPLLNALDAAALARVTDGTFWVGNDSDAFYLMLARAGELPAALAPHASANVVTTGTVPLLQQPDVYRGHTIRLVGMLQLAERKTAAENRAGIDSYWKLWVIPNDGGIRPTVLITPELPDAVASSLTRDGHWDRQSNPENPNGEIAAVARFIKRLPYRSSIGADLAPVVIGQIVAVKDSAASSQPVATEPVSTAPKRFGGWIGIMIAIVFGIAASGALMYRAGRDLKRTRRMRRRPETISLPPLASSALPPRKNDIDDSSQDPTP